SSFKPLILSKTSFFGKILNEKEAYPLPRSDYEFDLEFGFTNLDGGKHAASNPNKSGPGGI
ncbi:hypothetical protein, partial [Archaeoglobus sp.]